MHCRWLETSVQSAPWGRIFMIWKVGSVAAGGLLLPKTWPRPAISRCSFECSMRLWSRLRRLWWPPGSWAISLVNGRPMPFWVRSGTRFVNVLEKKAWPKIYWLLMLAEVYSLRGVPHLAPNRQTVDVAVDSISNNCRGSWWVCHQATSHETGQRDGQSGGTAGCRRLPESFSATCCLPKVFRGQSRR